MKNLANLLKNPNLYFTVVFALSLFMANAAFCADEIEVVSKKVQDWLFSSAIRKVALVLGMGAGLFQAFMSGSIRPLLIYGGLGLAVAFLPAVIDSIASINGAS